MEFLEIRNASYNKVISDSPNLEYLNLLETLCKQKRNRSSFMQKSIIKGTLVCLVDNSDVQENKARLCPALVVFKLSFGDSNI